jgi:phytol kinase
VREVAAFAGAAVVFVGILAAAEAATRRWGIVAELSRKMVHISSGVAAACLPLVMSFRTVVVLALAFVPFMVVSRRIDLFPAVHGVERTTLGEVWFPLGVALAAALVPHRDAFVFGVLVMGLSDAFASLAGRRWGRRGYRSLGATKTWLGSAAFLATTVALGVAATGGAGDAVAGVLATAAVLTVVEGLLGGGTDNVVLPVTAAALLRLWA